MYKSTIIATLSVLLSALPAAAANGRCRLVAASGFTYSKSTQLPIELDVQAASQKGYEIVLSDAAQAAKVSIGEGDLVLHLEHIRVNYDYIGSRSESCFNHSASHRVFNCIVGAQGPAWSTPQRYSTGDTYALTILRREAETTRFLYGSEVIRPHGEHYHTLPAVVADGLPECRDGEIRQSPKKPAQSRPWLAPSDSQRNEWDPSGLGRDRP